MDNCELCAEPMTPDDGEWITCPNDPTICIDCCGEDH